MLIRTNCNKVHSLKFSMVDSNLILFCLAGVCQELIGPHMALYALLHGDHQRWPGMRARIRAVGVNERAGCKWDLDVGRGEA